MINDIFDLYAFDKEVIKVHINDLSCIYFLHDFNMRTQYIGQTKNLRLRLFSHLKEKIFQDIKFVSYLQIEKKETRKSLEKEMIYRIKPELNKRFIHYEPK